MSHAARSQCGRWSWRPAALPVLLVAAGSLLAAPAMPQEGLHTFHVQGNVYAIFGAGGNITAQIGPDGVLLVDTGLAEHADAVLAEIRKLSKGPIRYIINTHVHPDTVGGNAKLGPAGSAIAGGNFARDIGDAGQGANIVAHENVLNEMSAPTGEKGAYPPEGWPTDTYFTAEKQMFVNGEALELIHIPAAHTDGDTMVFFRRSDVISAGGIFDSNHYPVIDRERGGNIEGVIEGLNRLIYLTIPAEKQEGGTYVIPGEGRICDQADIVEYRDMVTIIHDRIQDMVKRGMTLEQVKAAKPTLDYDAVFGSTTGPWTTDMFIEAVYESLKK